MTQWNSSISCINLEHQLSCPNLIEFDMSMIGKRKVNNESSQSSKKIKIDQITSENVKLSIGIVDSQLSNKLYKRFPTEVSAVSSPIAQPALAFSFTSNKTYFPLGKRLTLVS